MGNNGKDVKKYWSTPIGNIVDQTQNEIDNVVEQIKKSQIDYTETINNYQDDAYLRIKNLIDGSLEIQKSFITNLFRLPFTGNYPFLNTLIAIPFQDVIRQMENISDIYAKMLITLLESSNVTVSGIINNTKSTNRDQTNIFIDQLHYNTMQMSQIVNNAMRVVKDLSRTMADETPAKEIENVKKIERYVCINFPRQMSAGETAPLTVIVKNDSRSFLISSPTMVKGIGQIELKVPPNNEEILLLAYFSQEDSKFDLEDKLYCKEINIPVNDEDAQPVIFDLTAKTGGIAKMKIQFFKAAIGGYIGEIPLESIILDISKPENKSINDYIKELTIPITTGRFHSDVSALNPDMALFILQTKHNESGSEYEVYINSQEIGFRCFGIIPMSNQTKSKFLELFREIENADMSPDIIDDNVKNIGLQLYKEIIPPDLDRIYWRIRSNIKSIQVWSMEPWIPWEILKPSHKKEDDGLVEEDEFLCERYAFCRWQIGIPPKIKEQLRKVKIIVPSDTKLKGVLEERDWIKEFATSKGLNVSFASSYREVMSTLKSGDYDIIHFSTHGKQNTDTPVLSEIELGDGTKLKPTAINGLAQNFGQSHPLVILNACQSGVLDFSFTEIQGWATKFLEAGSSAFICTLWSVTDEIALEFTKEFYHQLFNGIPLGEAVRLSRVKCRKSGDPSWLAYEVYGHPNMKMELEKYT